MVNTSFTKHIMDLFIMVCTMEITRLANGLSTETLKMIDTSMLSKISMMLSPILTRTMNAMF